MPSTSRSGRSTSSATATRAKPDHPLEIRHYVDQVNHVLDALGAEKAYFTGESLGGWTTARYAIDHPDRVERIVLNTMGGTMANPKVMERLYTLSMEAAKDPSWERVKARLEWLMADPGMVTDDLIRTRQAIFQQPDWPKACEMNMALQDPETRKRNMLTDDDLRAIQAEALVIWTTKDPSGPVDEGRRIASLIPNARLAVMDNCGHWPQYEDTDTFNKIHLDFLLGRGGRRAVSHVTLALLAMSHSPLLEHAELDAEVSAELEAAFAEARRFVQEFDPDVIVNFAPDHYNGFFYRLMPPFCVGYAAESIGDYGSQAGRLDVPEDLARSLSRGGDRRRDRPGRVARHAGRPRRRAAHGDRLRRHHGPSRSSRSSSTPSRRRSPRSSGSGCSARPSAATSPPWTRRSCSSRPGACRTTRRCRGWPPRPPASDAC